ncbi:hypothetical protein LCGC14_1158670 [marine sediment metagenome]|uniref:Uncharacterized protein n=1 Tax=marine sediment metagenome TaxID=412755 RepID=A0A0F9LTB5_9ZZZZ
MPSSWITKSDGAEIRLAHPHNRAGMADGDRERSYDLVNDVRFQDADKTKTAVVLKTLLQEDLTTRTKLKDLPDDEPTKTVDPALQFGERMFWEGHGANKVVVSRSTIVESCVWDGERFVFTMRRVR